METQFTITYEIIEPVTNKSFVSKIRDEALEYYRDDYMVYETHETITQSSQHTQAITRVIMRWHNNPEFSEEE